MAGQRVTWWSGRRRDDTTRRRGSVHALCAPLPRERPPAPPAGGHTVALRRSARRTASRRGRRRPGPRRPGGRARRCPWRRRLALARTRRDARQRRSGWPWSSARRWRRGARWRAGAGRWLALERSQRYARQRGYRLRVTAAADTASPLGCRSASAGLPGVCFLMGGLCPPYPPGAGSPSRVCGSGMVKG